MQYSEIVNEIESLSYRDKLRLAQLLIQLARTEEEVQNPERRSPGKKIEKEESGERSDLNAYVVERLYKLRPGKKSGMINSIKAMFQFQGGISDADCERVIAELQKKRIIRVDENGRISYPDKKA